MSAIKNKTTSLPYINRESQKGFNNPRATLDHIHKDPQLEKRIISIESKMMKGREKNEKFINDRMTAGRYASIKVEQVRKNNYDKDFQSSINFGRYTLPEKVLNNDSQRELFSKNMRDFVIVSQKQKKIESAMKLRKMENDQRNERNKIRFENHQDKTEQNILKMKMDVKNLELRHNKAGNNIIQMSLKRLEQIQMKREVNNMKKQDQLDKRNALERQHQNNMLKLQAKHFKNDARTTLLKVSMDMTLRNSHRYK